MVYIKKVKQNSPLTKILPQVDSTDFYPLVPLFYFRKQMMFRNYNTNTCCICQVYFLNVSDILEVYLISKFLKNTLISKLHIFHFNHSLSLLHLFSQTGKAISHLLPSTDRLILFPYLVSQSSFQHWIRY